MEVVTIGAGDAAVIDDALRVVIALHAVLVRSAVGEIIEAGLSWSSVLKFPEILKTKVDAIADRPVIVVALDRIGERLPLRMAFGRRCR